MLLIYRGRTRVNCCNIKNLDPSSLKEMFINQKQADALLILSDEIDRPVHERKYGYLLFEEGKGCGHFSANTCSYSSVWNEEHEQYLYKTEEVSTLAAYSFDEKEYVFDVEHDTENIREFESPHPFEDFISENAIVFVSPELARIVDPGVDQKKQIDLIVEKLGNHPFCLQYALCWYSGQVGISVLEPVLVEREDGKYSVEEYKAMAKDPAFLEWVEKTVTIFKDGLRSN